MKNPYLYKAPGWKYIKLFVPDGNKWKKISTKTDNWSIAENFKNTFIKNPDAILFPQPEYFLFNTFLEQKYFKDKSFELTHLKRSKHILKYFVAAAGNKPLHTYSYTDINNFIDKYSDKSKHTIKSYLAIIDTVFNFAVSKKFIKSNPVDESKKINPGRVKIIYFSPDDFVSVLNTIIAAKDKLMLDFVFCLIHSGLRPNELCNLKKTDIFLDRQQFINHSSKVDEYKLKSIAKEILPIFQKRLNDPCNTTDYLFRYDIKHRKLSVSFMSHRFSAYVAKAGYKGKYSLYSLRKTYASWLLQAGIGIETVSKGLAHSKIETTKRHYGHLGETFDTSVNVITKYINKKALYKIKK